MSPTRRGLTCSEQSVSFISRLSPAAVAGALTYTKPAYYFLWQKTLLSADLQRLAENISQHKTQFFSCKSYLFLSQFYFLLPADNVNYHISPIFRVAHKTQFQRFKSGNIRDGNIPDNDVRVSITLRLEFIIFSEKIMGPMIFRSFAVHQNPVSRSCLAAAILVECRPYLIRENANSGPRNPLATDS